MSAQILVVDDEQDIVDTIAFALDREGFAVATAMSGTDAIESARSTQFDVVLLDVVLPGMSGLDVCRTLRAESAVPIIMLTARDAEVDSVLGLELGADDYVTKPFSMPELISRVRALLRRRELDSKESGGTILSAAGITMDLARHLVTVDGDAIILTPSEFRLLRLLVSDPGRVLSRRAIMTNLWQSDYVGDARACDVHISNLRRKIETDPAHPERIITVREAGYKLVDPSTEVERE